MAPKSPKSKKKYVSSEKLKIEIAKYFASSEDPSKRVISNELGKMILLIAKKYASRHNFSRYTFRDDFISDAIMRTIAKLDKIDCNHPKYNPFSYISKTCKHCFVKHIKAERKRREHLKIIQERLRSKFDEDNGIVRSRSNQESFVDELVYSSENGLEYQDEDTDI